MSPGTVPYHIFDMVFNALNSLSGDLSVTTSPLMPGLPEHLTNTRMLCAASSFTPRLWSSF